MASCLGISVGKNLIKYAKMSKEKNSTAVTIESYGIKFYDVLGQTLSEIIQETKSTESDVSVTITSEDYEKAEAYKDMKPKEREEYLTSEFARICSEKNVMPENLDVRYVLVDDPANPTSYKVLCAAVNKVELNNLWQALSSTKFQSISAIGSTITSLLPDKGVGQNCLIVNIEDDTKVTLVKNGKVMEIASLPVGMDEVIAKLADRYNSYARAYEACKGIDAYGMDGDLSFDPDAQNIRDALMPTLYDLKQRLMMATEKIANDFDDIYVTGTGMIVNNIDLYLAEAFPGKHAEILIPSFVSKERSNLKDILEVNSALAAANYYLNGVDKTLDYLASGNYLKAEKLKKDRDPKVIFGAVKEWIDNVNRSTLKTRKTGRKKKIEFEDEVANLGDVGISAPTFEEEVEYYDPMAEWLTRLAVSLCVAWIGYVGFSAYVENTLDTKLEKVNSNIAQSQTAIQIMNEDTQAITNKANEYNEKSNKLKALIDKLSDVKTTVSFGVPNFMSQLMFIIPSDVKIDEIHVGSEGNVIIQAQSPKYAQLGYFVSRLKLAGALKDVSMNVEDMSSNITITIRGVLP